jgi:hypothetical protein
MKQKLLFGVLGVALLGGIGFILFVALKANTPPVELTPNINAEQSAVEKAVLDFGKKLNMVSLTASRDVLVKSIEDNYAPFVSPELLEAWRQNPERAPGRMTSSPWPDRIEISKTQKDEDGSYSVGGRVIEITTTGVTANQYSVGLKLRNRDGKWIITGFTKALPVNQ